MRMFDQKAALMVTVDAVRNGSATAVAAARTGNPAGFSMLNGVRALLAGLIRPMLVGYRDGLRARLPRARGLETSSGCVTGRTFSTEYPLIMPTC